MIWSSLRMSVFMRMALKRYVHTRSSVVLIVIMLVFIVIGYRHSKHFGVIHNTNNTRTSSMTSGKRYFTYSDEHVYLTIKRTRFFNCKRRHPKGDHCSALRFCDELSDLGTTEGCKNSAQCRKLQEKNITEFCERRLPNAIIIGTYKSGTRALIDYLAMNPSVVIKRQPKYEVSYFDRHADKGLQWYKEQMPLGHERQITVEKSPGYFTSKEAPRRIYELNKDIKLILIVRDPIDRAWSHLTFETFITKEQYENNINNCLYKYTVNKMVLNENCFAIKASIYDEALQRYLDYFPLKQIHVIDAAEFVDKPCSVLKDLERFLNIHHYIDCDNLVPNEAKGVYCVQDKLSDNHEASCYGMNRGRQKLSKPSRTLENQLQTLFKPHTERFFKLIGKRFQWK